MEQKASKGFLGLLLLLSRFSRVRLCATPWMAAYQAPLSLGFSKQEHWVGCHFLLQCMKVKSEREVTQSCLTLCDPIDGSPPGSSVHGIFQASVLEWGRIIYTIFPPVLNRSNFSKGKAAFHTMAKKDR